MSSLKIPNLVAFIAAGLMILSALLFDNELLKQQGFHHVGTFLILGTIVLILLNLLVKHNNKYFIISKARFAVYSLSFFALLMAFGHALISGILVFNAFLGNVIILIISILFFRMGSHIIGSYQAISSLGFYVMLFSLASLVLYLVGVPANRNWVFIALILSFFIYSISKDISERNFLIGILLISIISLINGSRGVFLAALTGLILVLVARLFVFKKLEKMISRFGAALVFFACISSFFIGVIFFNSELYQFINIASIEFADRSIDSSRLGRWSYTYNLFIQRPFLGYGLDASISRILLVDEGASHNLWGDILLKGGAVLFMAYVVLFSYLLFNIFRYSQSLVPIVVVSGLFVLTTIYGLGGFTHWPGTFMFWFILGLISNRSALARWTESPHFARCESPKKVLYDASSPYRT